ncbi:MAG: Dabb family protein [Solimonas sp.]
MLRRVELIRAAVPGGLPAEALAPLRTDAGNEGALLQATLPGVYNGGDWLRRSAGDAERLAGLAASAVLAPAASVDGAIYEEIESGGDWSGAGVYRALLLSVRPAVSAERQARFARELLAMPRHIGAIRAWRLGRVLEAEGARAWSHVWEQRYDTLAGLAGDYMLHPYHWAHVDRWFDPESPDWIVDPHLCHSFCAMPDGS